MSADKDLMRTPPVSSRVTTANVSPSGEVAKKDEPKAEAPPLRTAYDPFSTTAAEVLAWTGGGTAVGALVGLVAGYFLGMPPEMLPLAVGGGAFGGAYIGLASAQPLPKPRRRIIDKEHL